MTTHTDSLIEGRTYHGIRPARSGVARHAGLLVGLMVAIANLFERAGSLEVEGFSL